MALETVPATSVTCSWYDIPCNASSALAWLWDALNFIPRRIWSGILDALATVVESIPAPAAFADLSSNAAAFNALNGTAYLADIVALGYALSVVASAMLARFLFSLIPVIGR